MAEVERNFSAGTVTFELNLMLHDSGSGRSKHTDFVEQAAFLMAPIARYIEEHFQFHDAQVFQLRYMGDATTGTEPLDIIDLAPLPWLDE